MAQPITLSNPYIAGRFAAAGPPSQNVSTSFQGVDFTGANSSYLLDFTTIYQQGIFGILKTMFIDNSQNPTEVVVIVSGTQQTFTIPAQSEGYFPITASEKSKVQLTSVGGAGAFTNVVFYNYDVPPSVWYKNGLNLTNTSIMAQGTNPTGSTVSTNTQSNPLYTAGRSPTGTLQPFSVDATGNEIVVGTTVIGTALVGNPVTISGTDAGGLVRAFRISTNGGVSVDGDGLDGVAYTQQSVATGGLASATAPAATTGGFKVRNWSFLNGQQAVTIVSSTGTVVPVANATDGLALQSSIFTNATFALYNGTTTNIGRDIVGAAIAGTGTQAVAYAPNSVAGGAVSRVFTTTAQSGLVIKASAGNLYGYNIVTGATAGYLMIFDAVAVPADGTVTPKLCIPIAANTGIQTDRDIPLRFTTGISICFSTTGPFTKTASATAFLAGDAA